MNKFWGQFVYLKDKIDLVISDVQVYFIIPMIIALVMVVHKMTGEDADVDGKRIFMVILSVVLIMNYSEITYNITGLCNSLSTAAYNPQLVKANPNGGRTYERGYGGTYIVHQDDVYVVEQKGKIRKWTNKLSKWISMEHVFLGQSMEDLDLVTDDWKVVGRDDYGIKKYMEENNVKSFEEALIAVYADKGFSGKVRNTMMFVQFVWAVLLFFLGPIFILLGILNDRITLRFLSEFVAINLWPLAFAVVDYVRFSFAGQDGFDSGFFTALNVAYIFAPLMISMLIPGTVSNSVLQRVTGMVGVGAGIAGMVGKGAAMAARKVILKV